MWEIESDKEQRVVFQDPAHGWSTRCWAGRPEAGIQFDHPGLKLAPEAVVKLLPPDAPTQPSQFVFTAPPQFPPISDFYFRDADVIAELPQTEPWRFGLTLTHRIIHCDADWIGVESIVSIQTNLLDSHPTVDLVAGAATPLQPSALAQLANPHAVLPPANAQANAEREIPAPLFRLAHSTENNGKGEVVLMLPPSDRAAATLLAPTQQALHVRLLAEFLEKGVIRKARYWTTCWTTPATEENLIAAYQTLATSPLPLTP